MEARLYSRIFFFQVFSVLQFLCGSTRAREIPGEPWNVGVPEKPRDQMISPSSDIDGTDIAVHVLFHEKDLKLGNKITIYFPIKDPSSRPPLLSREEADSIPFSSSQLPYLFQLFSFSPDSSQAKAMMDTLKHCEQEPAKGETKFCATSLESMLDSIGEMFGSKTRYKTITTNHLTNETTSILQKYTIQEEPRVISDATFIPCHILPYPYAVFFCHGQKKDNKLLKVSLVGEDGGRVDAVATCHMDTSHWNPNHVAFRVLKFVPGRPVCHFIQSDNLVWLPSTSV